HLIAAAILNTDAELPFKAWEKAKADTRTLIVEYTVEQRTYWKTKSVECVLKLRRRDDGTYQVRLDGRSPEGQEPADTFHLLGRDVYQLPTRPGGPVTQ